MGDIFVSININNWGPKTVVVKNVHLFWGKFYKDNDRDSEIPIKDIENTKILSGNKFKINSRGRSASSAGTEGEFDIYEDGPGGERVGHFYWDCPWGSKSNTWRITDRNAKWTIDSSEPDPNGGTLGDITVDLFKKD
ncbi:pleurotolysin A [Russula aff. rugulosa BPL654]|nr:pleurotolysin A [Russula aff. rugulosa BPL654]